MSDLAPASLVLVSQLFEPLVSDVDRDFPAGFVGFDVVVASSADGDHYGLVDAVAAQRIKAVVAVVNLPGHAGASEALAVREPENTLADGLPQVRD